MVRTPYLIQRGSIVTPLATRDQRLSHAVKFDYMGSAEFEFGALPKSFQRIEQNADNFIMTVFAGIKDSEGRSLRVWHYFSESEFAEYAVHLVRLRNNEIATKETTHFDKSYQSANHGKFFKSTDFWWDIDNNVMFGFDKNFMNRVGDYVAASLIYMNRSD